MDDSLLEDSVFDDQSDSDVFSPGALVRFLADYQLTRGINWELCPS